MGIDLQSPSMLANSIPLCYREENACVTFKALPVDVQESIYLVGTRVGFDPF
jgi:hypothetical protein